MYDAEMLRNGDEEKNTLSLRYVITVSPHHRVSVSVPEEL